jgi:exopolyphosphatase/guanosine-5'-triphosphate,3'-diphosphate pyrophosphatase
VEQFDIPLLYPAKGALRQGVIFDLVERLKAQARSDHRDLRDTSVEVLQKRFQVDMAQAERVRRTALELYASLAPQATLEQVREVGWAADLHEIGMAVSHHDHHRHSAYLIAHVDAPGYSQSQQRLLGRLVLGQRGGLRKVQDLWDDPTRMGQMLALRLAVLLCHPRIDAPEGLQVTWQPGLEDQALSLRWPANWPAELPRMVYLLEEEAAAWSRLDALSVDTGFAEL